MNAEVFSAQNAALPLRLGCRYSVWKSDSTAPSDLCELYCISHGRIITGGKLKKMKRQDLKLQSLVGTAILAAIVALLTAYVAIPIGAFTITLSLVPIIIGAIIYGPRAGAVLGGVFGAIVSIMVVTGAAGILSFTMFQARPFITLFLCMLKGIAAGFVSGVIYSALKKAKQSKIGVILSAIACPIVNTGLFVGGLFVFYYGIIADFAAQSNFAGAISFVFIGIVGINFIVEFVVNVALIPLVVRLIDILSPKKKA